MQLLITGIAIFTLVHLLLSIAPGLKLGIINATSEKTWKRIFSLIVLISLIMIVIGWRNTPIEYTYVASPGLRHLTMLLMLLAFILFGAAKGPTNIKQFIRHPMLIAILVWAVAHLISNGETRSLVLFASFGIWALMEMFFISRREGAWNKPEPVPLTRSLKNIIISIVMFAVVMMLHGYFTGISLIPAA